MISFIVPAHNEQSYLGKSLAAIHEAAGVVGQPYEIIVVDDASTDATTAVAQEQHANVVSVNHRQIAATRNSGARAARGERLFFVDADTMINPRVVESALRAMDKGAAGGGALAVFDGKVPLYAHLMLFWFGLFMRLAEITGGACMFCRRTAFDAVGGFNERLFGGEDAAMSSALKREGRFVVLWPHVVTSGRRMRGIHGLQMLATLIRMAFSPGMLKGRANVKKIWYESQRDEAENAPDSLAIRASNAVMLLIMIGLVIGPFWNFVPRSLMPPGSVLGEICWWIAIVSCHVGLVLWPCSYFLLRSLLRQKRWIERLKLSALIALCLWLAWGAAREVFWFWAEVYRWLVY
jgi:glycosyltransferase involved in cell wall biosynthesis